MKGRESTNESPYQTITISSREGTTNQIIEFRSIQHPLEDASVSAPSSPIIHQSPLEGLKGARPTISSSSSNVCSPGYSFPSMSHVGNPGMSAALHKSTWLSTPRLELRPVKAKKRDKTTGKKRTRNAHGSWGCDRNHTRHGMGTSRLSPRSGGGGSNLFRLECVEGRGITPCWSGHAEGEGGSFFDQKPIQYAGLDLMLVRLRGAIDRSIDRSVSEERRHNSWVISEEKTREEGGGQSRPVKEQTLWRRGRRHRVGVPRGKRKVV